MLNLIIDGRNNPIIINTELVVKEDPNFTLASFQDITVGFGTETYTLRSNPAQVSLPSANQLQLNLGTVTQEMTASYFDIVGYSPNFPQGVQLTSKCLRNLNIPRLCC